MLSRHEVLRIQYRGHTPARHRPHRASDGDGLHGIGMGVSRWRTQGYECESCQDIETRQESQIAGKVWPGRNRKRIPQTALQAEIRCLQIFVMYLVFYYIICIFFSFAYFCFIDDILV